MNRSRAFRVYSLFTVIMLLISPLSSLFLWNLDLSQALGEEVLEPLSTITDETLENNFGWNVSWAGDINGDGFDDIIAGAPYAYSGISGGRWWNSSWTFRKKLVFNNSQQVEDLIYFPVLVNLSLSNFNYSKAKSDGSDLRFIDTDSKTQLNYHIEEWNPLGNSYIWVNVSQILGSSSSDFIWMYYGNPGASDNQDITGTYDGNYMGVWHLNETLGTHYDATSNNNDGTPQGGVTQNTAGNIDGADSFDGSGDFINFGTSDSLNISTGITIEAWVKPINIDNPGNDQNIVNKFDTNARSYILSLDDDAGDNDDWDFKLSSSGTLTEGDIHATNAVDRNQWQYMVGTWSGTTMILYKNANVIGTNNTFSGPIYQSATELWIGDGLYYDAYEGFIDEVRISNSARSADYIAASYLSMDNKYITYNPEEINSWWNSNWQFRKKLTFDNSGQSEDLVNFPVLVKLNPANFDYLNAKTDGTDLRFIDNDGTSILNYHIESWSASQGSFIWVNVPKIDSGSSIDFMWMYYGNSTASDVQDVTGTFNSDYLGVWHLNETIGTHFDATSTSINGVPFGGVTQDESGPIDGADLFDQINDYLKIDPLSLDNYTISTWVKGDGTIIGYENVSMKTSLDLKGESPDTTIYGARGQDELGSDVSWGDINGDGINDTVIGSIGSVFIIYGDISRPDPDTIDLNSQSANITIRGEAHDRFGTRVAIGDMNNDGIDDLIIGAILKDNPGRSDSGAAYVIYGYDYASGTTIDLTVSSANITIYGESANDNLGRSVATGDINSDGIDDVIVGASGASPGSRGGAGSVYVLYGDNYPSTMTLDLNSQPANLTIHGNDPGSTAGMDVASGDINNDGFDDIIVGASGADPAGGNNAGEAYVIYGLDYASGTVIDLNSDSANVTIYGNNEDDNLGRVLASGDINNDGFDDVICGVYWADSTGGNRAGAVCVIYGADYASGTEFDLNSTSANLTILGDDASDYLGYSVSSGDINGDGFSDVIAGAYGTAPSGGNDAGTTYVIYGLDYASGTIIDLNLTSANLTIHGDDSSDLSGISVSSGDMNEDGICDVIIGATAADPPGGTMAGEAYVIYGADYSSGSIIDLNLQPANVTVMGDNATDKFGRAMASGDVNADGYNDLIIGAYTAVTPGGFDTGKTYVFYGRSGFTPTIDLAVDSADITIYGDSSGDYSGYAVSSGDVNSDGYDDIIIGAYGTDGPGGISCGAAYVIYGGNYASGTIIDLDITPADITIYGDDVGDNFGRTVASGDINNDGFSDVIAGATWANAPAGSNEGAAYVIFGFDYMPGTIIDLNSESANLAIYGENSTDYCGLALATGDVNFDGFDDIIVGAYGADPAGVNGAGETYVFFGTDFAPGSVIDLSFESANLTVYGNGTLTYSGFAVSSGDINNDGYSDVIIGAYQADPGSRNEAGETYAIYGGNYAPGSSIDLSSESANLTIMGDDANDRLGRSVYSEDVNNDGFSDLIIGAYMAETIGGSQNGETYVIFGYDYPSGKVIDLNLESANLTIYGIDSVDRMGSTVHSKDINGDGFAEIISGAYEADFKNRYNSGEVYIINPLATAEIIKVETVEGRIRTVFAPNRNTSSVISPVLNTGIWHGVTISKGSSLDLNIDGVLIGSTNVDGNSIENTIDLTLSVLNQNGTLRNYFGGIIDEVKILKSARSQDWIFAQYLSESDNFISFSFEENREADSGCAYVFFGYLGFTQNNIFTSNADVAIYGENPEDQFGWSVSGAGDINSDGFHDVIIGAPGWGNDTGRAYIFYGRSSWNQSYSASEANVILTGENEGDRFGSSLSGMGTSTNHTKSYTDWMFRKKITISSSQVVDDLVDFPVLINITDTDLRDRARTDGYDIFFTELDGTTKLHHEVERYNGSTGELASWVKIPSLSSSFDKIIYMYYCNPARNIPMERPSAVWDSNYRAVWHLNDDFLDSTNNYNHGTNFGSDDKIGVIAKGQDFENDDSTDKIDVGNWNIEGQELTLQAWVKFESFSSDGRIISKADGNSDGDHTWMLSEINDTIRLRVRTSSTIALEATSVSLSNTPWYFAVGTYDGINMRLRLDKTEVESTAQTGNIQQDVRGIAIGNQPESTVKPFDGTIDEVRVSSIRRSDAWLDTEYNNIMNSSVFHSVGLEEINAPSWQYRKPITINSSEVAGDLTDFPVLINQIDSDLLSKARLDGYDIVFTSTDGKTRLDHEIESYNSSSGELVAWVRIPSLSSSSDTIIYMHYGNIRTISPTENPADVWDDDFVMIQHLKETSGTHYDATQYDYNGIEYIDSPGTQDAIGKIDGADEFDGSDDYIKVNNLGTTMNGKKNITFSLWINTASDVGVWRNPFSFGDGKFRFEMGNPATNLHIFNSGIDNDEVVEALGSINLGEWNFIAFASNDSTWTLYVDGLSKDVGTTDGGLNAGSDLFLGARNEISDIWKGLIDEVHVSKTTRPVDWIATEYNNQNNTSTFYSVGTEESFPQKWLYRKAITINNSKLTEDLTNFPVLVNTVDLDLMNKARPDGYDIVFTGIDGMTRLDHEIETYNSSSGELVAWIKVPYISSTLPTTIYMHYGNSAQSIPTENPQGVWDDDYNGIWHLSDGGIGTRYDSTENNNHGTPANYEGDEAISLGKIAGADEFDGDNDRISIPDNSSLDPQNDITVEAWVRFNELSSTKGSEQKIVFKDHSGLPWVSFELRMDLLDQIMIQWVNESQSYETAGYFGSVSTDTWYYIVGVKKGNSLNFYFDSDTGSTWTDTTSGLMFNSDGPLHFGTEGTQSYLNGSIDEVRVSDIARSWDWINTTFMNHNETSLFYSVGPEEINTQKWLYRKAITQDASKITEDLTNFPILINTVDLNLKNTARSDGYDILFTDIDGITRLNHEIESYNSSSGELVAWVKVPFVSSTLPTSIYMYYGNSNQTIPTENPQGVWDDDYHAVWHLNEFGNGSKDEYMDSTSNSYDGQGGSGVLWRTPIQTNSKIGYGQDFDGINDIINFSSMNPISYNDFTFEAWYKSTNLIVDTDQYIFAHLENGTLGPGVVFSITNNAGKEGFVRVTTRNMTQEYDTYYGASDVHDQKYHHIVGIRENGFIKLYVDGKLDNTLIDNHPGEILNINSPQTPVVGDFPSANEEVNGTLDEIRVSRIARSWDWINASYANQNNTSSFYSIGSEESSGSSEANCVIIGAYGYDNNRGRVYAFSGEGGLSGEISASSANSIINGSSQGNLFGWDVSFADDVNNDGLWDIIVGAPGNNSDTGSAYIFNSVNSLSSFLDSSNAYLTLNGKSPGDGFGFSVSSAKDLNNDGFSDVIVGAPFADNPETDLGSAYIYFGNTTMDNLIDVNIKGENIGDGFGFSVAYSDDFDGDGFSDVIVGAPFYDAGPISDAGAIYVFSGGSGMDSTSDWICVGTQTYEHFGWSVSSSQNLDNKSLSYLIVGAPNNQEGGLNAGKIFILEGLSAQISITNILALPPTQLINNFVNLTCDVSALNGVDSVWVNITIPSGGFLNASMVPGAGDQYYYYDNYSQPSIYQYTIWANDSLGDTILSSGWQFEMLSGNPLLSLEQVNPNSGLINTYYNFTVQYTHPSNLPPDIFTVNITGPSHAGSWDMVEVDSGDTDYMDGKSYYYNYTGFTIGSYSFHFAANDSNGIWDESTTLPFNVLDSAPLLSLEQVDPITGYSSFGFNFTVQYTHPSDLPPETFTVNITGPSHAGSWNMVESDSGDTDYTDGKSYYYNYTGFGIGSYSFHFAANDTNGIWDETVSSPFDVLDESPTLSSQQISPNSGYIDTNFNFTMVYTSVLDLSPSNITVNISGIGIFDLVEVDPLDSDHTDGKAYYLNASGFPVGNHPFNFAARDTIGNWAEGTTLFFDVLNSTPQLSSPLVNPTNGYEITNFNFTVTYTSPNNLAPDNILVKIIPMETNTI
jgi:hypothetical protein